MSGGSDDLARALADVTDEDAAEWTALADAAEGALIREATRVGGAPRDATVLARYLAVVAKQAAEAERASAATKDADFVMKAAVRCCGGVPSCVGGDCPQIMCTVCGCVVGGGNGADIGAVLIRWNEGMQRLAKRADRVSASTERIDVGHPGVGEEDVLKITFDNGAALVIHDATAAIGLIRALSRFSPDVARQACERCAARSPAAITEDELRDACAKRVAATRPLLREDAAEEPSGDSPGRADVDHQEQKGHGAA